MCLGLTSVGKVSFAGRNGAGNIAVSGLQAGDLLVVYDGNPAGYQLSQDMALNVASADTVQQFATGDQTSTTYVALVFRSS